MTDTGGGGERDSTGGGNFTSNVSSSVDLGQIAAQSTAFKTLASAIDAVGTSLGKLSTSSTKDAQTITNNLNKISNAMGNGGSGSGSGSGSNGNYQAQRAQASAATGNSSDSGGPRSGMLTGAAGWLGYQSGEDMAAGLAMAPLRFVRDRIQTNRNVVLGASSALSMNSIQSGASQADMLSQMSRNPGNVMGTTSELLQLMSIAPSLGAAFGFNNGTSGVGNGVRGQGFFQGIAQAQSLNPGASMSSLISTIGGQAANTKSQQQSVMMTGGAYSMIAQGGRQKSLSEWADSVMKWLVEMRPGGKRGKPFGQEELMAQYYPGSNIDAWFDANGVSQEMRSYWWTYALGKAGGTISEDSKGLFTRNTRDAQGVLRPDSNNLASLRLQSANALTQGEFSLGAGMSGAYGNREQSNRAFNEMIQSFISQMLPAALASGPLASIQYMPDMVEDLLFGLLEKSPSKFQTAAGIGFAGSALFSGMGDVGDIGDMPGTYGAMGGTTTSGMNPDMKRKLGAMQRANPKIRITSGLRDTGLQQSLKKKGYSNVSGKPSAHTRGMAADLGPASEYGWIVKNASKFGLHSGASHGEPWHVGIGDFTDDAMKDIAGQGNDKLLDVIMDTFGGLISGKSSGAEGMFDMFGSLLGFLGGAFSSSGKGVGPAYEGDLYSRLAAKARTGITIKTSPFVQSGGGRLDNLPGVLGEVIGNQLDPGTRASGIRAATALFNAGFRDRNSLETMTAISWRESRWNPEARNPNTSDRGLMQINMAGQKSLLQSMGYDEQDLFDIQKNAQVAHRVYQNAGNSYWPWGMTAGGWSRNGNPLYGTEGSHASAIVDATGLVGDIPDFQYTPMGGAMSVGKNVVFNNTFQIGGGSMGGGSGLDMRRMVTVMADHLEGEMKQRVARSN